MPSEFSITRTVEFAETDMAGIMHFANFFLWMESCEAAFYRSLNLPLVSLVPGEGVCWPRVNVSCQYHAPLRFNDVAEVRLFVKKIGVRSLTYVFKFHQDSLLIATGEVTVVCVTATPGKALAAQPIPASVRAKLEVAAESQWMV